MKILTTVLSASLLLLAQPLHAALSAVSVSATQILSHGKADPKEPSKSEQKEKLNIVVRNSGKEDLGASKVVYYIFSHDLAAKQDKILKTGELSALLAPGAEVKLESPEAVATSDTGRSAPGAGGKGKPMMAAKKTPASGEHIIGWAVRVLDSKESSKVLAEAASTPAMLKLIDTATAVAPKDAKDEKKPLAPKKK